MLRKCQSFLRSLLTAFEAFVGPHVGPLTVPTAIGNSKFIQVAVYSFEGSRPIEIKNHVCKWDQHRFLAKYLVVVPKESAPSKICYDRLDPVARGIGQRSIFAGKIDFRLDAPGA